MDLNYIINSEMSEEDLEKDLELDLQQSERLREKYGILQGDLVYNRTVYMRRLMDRNDSNVEDD